jgi:hypothetical protein
MPDGGEVPQSAGSPIYGVPDPVEDLLRGVLEGPPHQGGAATAAQPAPPPAEPTAQEWGTAVDRAFADLPRDNAERTYDTLERELGGYIALPGEHATRPQVWHRHKALLVIAFLALLVVVARFILIGADRSPSAADVAAGWARCRFVAGMIDCEQQPAAGGGQAQGGNAQGGGTDAGNGQAGGGQAGGGQAQGGVAQGGAQPPVAAEAIGPWSIIGPEDGAGLTSGAVFDRVDLTIPNLDPAGITWLAVSNADRLQELPTGENGNIPAVPGQPVLNQPNMDDYIVITVTGPSGEAPKKLVIDRNDEYGAAEGIQAVLVGTFPRVRVVSHIDWDQSITTSELRSESGELTAWFHGQGKGTFSFHFEFVNEYTELSSHPALWLVAGTAQPGGG